MASTRSSPALRWAALALVVLALAAGAWLEFGRKNERTALGRELVFDDFGFRIEPPKAEHVVTGLAPTGELKIVRLRVSNHAKTVAYEMSSHVPLLIDAEGRAYPALGSAIEWPASSGATPHAIAAGESCAQELYFDVPKDARDLHLKVSWGELGDRLDHLLIGDKSLAIE